MGGDLVFVFVDVVWYYGLLFYDVSFWFGGNEKVNHEFTLMDANKRSNATMDLKIYHEGHEGIEVLVLLFVNAFTERGSKEEDKLAKST